MIHFILNPSNFSLVNRAKNFYESRQGVYVNNAAGLHVAALKFNSSEPYCVWIRKDIDARQQHLIASLFSLMMVARSDYFW